MFNLLKYRMSLFWIFVILLFLCIILYTIGVFSNIDDTIFSNFFRIKSFLSSETVDEIVIIETGKYDLDRNQLWPWGGEWFPYFSNFLFSFNPRLVIFLTPYTIQDFDTQNELLKRIDLSKFFVISDDNFKELVTIQNLYFNIKIKNKAAKQPSVFLDIISVLLLEKETLKNNLPKIENADISELAFSNMPLKNNYMIINMVPDHVFEYYSYFDIMVKAQRLDFSEDHKSLKTYFKDKIVIFSDSEKIYDTSLGSFTKAEVLANAIYTVLKQKYIRAGYIFSIPFIIFVGFLLFLIFTKFNLASRTLIWLSSLCGIFLFCYYTYNFFGLIITVSAPLVLSTLLYVNINIFRFFQKRNIKLEQKKAELAKDIKYSFIPPHIPKVDSLDIQVGMLESEKVGGDFYNLIRFNKNRLSVFLGTYPGYGLGAVNNIERIISQIKLVYTKDVMFDSLFKRLNRDLYSSDGTRGKYLRLLLADIDSKEGTVRMINSGQINPFVYHSRSSHLQKIHSFDPTPLGLYRNRVFQEQVFRLNSQDMLILYSAGMFSLIEKVGHKTNKDIERFFSSIKKPSQIINKILSETRKVYVKDIRFEDATIIIIKLL